MNIGLPYILPRLAGFLLPKVYPFASSLHYSFTDYDSFNGITKTGFLGYEKISTNEDIIRAFVVTSKYTILDVPLKLAFVLFIAYILNFKLKGVSFLKTTYYVPLILGGSITIAIFRGAVFNADGLINTVVIFFEDPKVNWMAGANSALFVTVPLCVWQFDSVMVIFPAALKGVSEDLYEAISIDDAGKQTQFLKVTVPLITPVIFYNLITQFCQTFQESNALFLATKSGPNGVAALISTLIYNNALPCYKMRAASAQAWILFLTVMTLTAVALISRRK